MEISNMAPTQQSILQDPSKLYPRPEYPTQPQDIPGQTQPMEPTPDHGEQTYVGSGKLEGLVALLTGADSGIGRAVALAYAREGADIDLASIRDYAVVNYTDRLVCV